MNYLASNMRYLRKTKKATQEELANAIGVNRSMVGSYEEGRAVPRISALQLLSHYFKVTIDDLINKDLKEEDADVPDAKGSDLRVLSMVVDSDDKELITLVGVKASAGYLNGYSDPEYISSLPRFSLPVRELSSERTYRAFQITGDSMLPIPSSAYILCSYVQNWDDVTDGKRYIVVTNDDGIVFKRVYNQPLRREVLFKSDNPEYKPYKISLSEVTEVWEALGYLSFEFPETDRNDIGNLSRMIMDMRGELDELKKENKH